MVLNEAQGEKYALFNDTVSNLDYIVSDVSMTGELWIRKSMEGSGYVLIYLERLRKAMKNHTGTSLQGEIRTQHLSDKAAWPLCLVPVYVSRIAAGLYSCSKCFKWGV
jgi:hypothetical protein